MTNEIEFKKYLIDEQGTSDATANAYVADVKEYETYIQKHGKGIFDSRQEDIKAFLNDLKREGKRGSTVNRKMVSVRKYFEFLRIKGRITKNPAFNVKVPKVEYKVPEYLSIEQIVHLLDEPDESDLGKRDKAMLELLYACGLKASELAALNIQDLDLRIGFVSCHGDNTKARIIPMGQHARKAMLVYMKDVRGKLVGAKEDLGALFLNYAGERITRQGIWKIVKYYGQKTGLSDDLSPQIIRNSFAAHMIKNGADLKSLQELLGNEDITTTKLFIALSKARIMDVYDKTHPRA